MGRRSAKPADGVENPYSRHKAASISAADNEGPAFQRRETASSGSAQRLRISDRRDGTNPQSFRHPQTRRRATAIEKDTSASGGSDRRPTDDGGHYIAARFEGATDAFNHFAQDANFNRGRYRALEDQWARAKRAGRNVTVTIVPSYNDASKRPAMIDISFTINGHKQSVKLANESREKPRGK